jgi:hypothetical protein
MWQSSSFIIVCVGSLFVGLRGNTYLLCVTYLLWVFFDNLECFVTCA